MNHWEHGVMGDVVNAWAHQRQRGYNVAHDTSHRDGELSCAAAAYAIELIAPPTKLGTVPRGGELWPWPGDGYKPRSRRENLLRATAFLLSELVRLDVEEAERAGKCRHCGSNSGQNCQCREW